jgi:predicted nucleic acid-binding protein
VRIVLDTGILVRANTHSRGPAREVLLAIVTGPHELVTSAFLLNETERVLRYPRLLARHGLTDLEIADHVDYLRRVSELVHVVVREPVVLSDPDDNPVVYTAVDRRDDGRGSAADSCAQGASRGVIASPAGFMETRCASAARHTGIIQLTS